MGNKQNGPEKKSFQTGQLRNPSLRDLLFNNCCSKINTNESVQYIESDIFFGNKIESIDPQSIELINQQINKTVVCSCMCENCLDRQIIKSLTDSILQIQQQNQLGALVASPQNQLVHEPVYAQVDVLEEAPAASNEYGLQQKQQSLRRSSQTKSLQNLKFNGISKHKRSILKDSSTIENCRSLSSLHQKPSNRYMLNPTEKEDNLLKGSFYKQFDGEKFGIATGPDKQLLSRATSQTSCNIGSQVILSSHINQTLDKLNKQNQRSKSPMKLSQQIVSLQTPRMPHMPQIVATPTIQTQTSLCDHCRENCQARIQSIEAVAAYNVLCDSSKFKKGSQTQRNQKPSLENDEIEIRIHQKDDGRINSKKQPRQKKIQNHNIVPYTEMQPAKTQQKFNVNRILIDESHTREYETSGKRSPTDTAATAKNLVADSTVMNIDTPAMGPEPVVKRANAVMPSADFKKITQNQQDDFLENEMEFDVFTFQKKKVEDVVQSCVIDSDDDHEPGKKNMKPKSLQNHMAKFKNQPAKEKKNKFTEQLDSTNDQQTYRHVTRNSRKSMKQKTQKKENEGKMTKFQATCQASYTYRYIGHGKNINKSSPTEFNEYHLVLQKNDKLVLFTVPKKQNPLAKFQVPKNAKGKNAEKFQKKYLSCQTEYGNIEQINSSKQCKPDMVLEIGALSVPRVPNLSEDLMELDKSFKNGKKKIQYSSLVQLQREENYADQSKAKELIIKIYSYDNDYFRELMMANNADSDSYYSDHNFVKQNEVKKSKRSGSDFFQDNDCVDLKLTLTLRFHDYKDMIECFQQLDAIIENNQSQNYHVMRQMYDFHFWTNKLPVYTHLLTNQYMFWMFNSISEEQFLKHVDTGDVLLFRCESPRQGIFGAWVTRALTKSHYDHVAVILRFGDYVKDLYILEAVGDRGVRITSWINLRSELYVNGFFEKIVTRKLMYEMTTQKLTDLDLFRRNCVGHRYGLSAKKLLFNQASESDLHEDGRHTEIPDDRQFFCSELVAKAFKVLNVLRNPEKGSNNYYPSSFDLGESIDQDLKDDVALGPPLNIIVNGKLELDKNSNLQQQRQSDIPLAFQPDDAFKKGYNKYVKNQQLSCYL